MLQRSKWSGLLLAACVSTAGALQVATVFGQATPADTAPAASAPASAPAEAATAPAIPDNVAALADKKLETLADDFMHYSLVNNLELAKANGQALLLAKATPEEFLQAFEAAANGRVPRDVLMQDMRRAPVQDEPEPFLKDLAPKILDKLDEGYRVVARDPVRVRAEVEKLANGPRPYQNAKERLIDAGQFAAPILIEYLQNANKKELHPYIIRVMGEIGRPLLNPLIEELRISDPTIRIELVNVIGQIRYPQALPALRTIQADPATTGELKKAVDAAIALIDRTGQAASMSASDLSLKAAENYYDKKPSYQPLLPDEKTNPIWVFDPNLNNVQNINVPTAIWNSVMALRLAEATLRADENNEEAIALWLAASLRREIQLPAGATDPTKVADMQFIAMAAGPKYMNRVLGRALDGHDAALALRAMDSLEATSGTQGLVTGGENAPLVRALSYPDRSVRFRAAFALASANANSQFPSFYRVVPILSEAVNSTGAPTALVVGSNEDEKNKLTQMLRAGDSHYQVFSGDSLASALEQARRAPAIDLIIVPNGLDMNRVADMANNDYRLAAAPVLVIADKGDVSSLRSKLADKKGYGVIESGADEATIMTALAAARAEAGNVPLDAEKSTSFALQALKLLDMLAADHHSIYTVNEAVPTLTEALKDKRPEIATASARVLGKINSVEGERALATSALSGDTDGSLRIVFFESLAESAKRTGDSLDASMINALIKLVNTEPDAKLKLAASEALGALNVPSNQASKLILQQAK